MPNSENANTNGNIELAVLKTKYINLEKQVENNTNDIKSLENLRHKLYAAIIIAAIFGISGSGLGMYAWNKTRDMKGIVTEAKRDIDLYVKNKGIVEYGSHVHFQTHSRLVSINPDAKLSLSARTKQNKNNETFKVLKVGN